ncbi:hypothetical protein NUM3379_34870 [Kineococcus sp. NUM-3379]
MMRRSDHEPVIRTWRPPNWPPAVPPPSVEGWDLAAGELLMDFAPASWRAEEALHRHPVLLAWLAAHQIQADINAARRCWRELGDPEAIGVLAEQAPEDRLALREAVASTGRDLAARGRGTVVLHEALRGRTWRPRL